MDANADITEPPDRFRFLLDTPGTLVKLDLILHPVTVSIAVGMGPGMATGAVWADGGVPPPCFTTGWKGHRVFPEPATRPTTTGAGPDLPRGRLHLISLVGGISPL